MTPWKQASPLLIALLLTYSFYLFAPWAFAHGYDTEDVRVISEVVNSASPEDDGFVIVPSSSPDPCSLFFISCTNEKTKTRTVEAWVTAFTSEKGQTDSTPEISASNENIWELYKKGEMTCASNIFPFQTILFIDGVGECTVRDRMNKRFDNTFQIDYYMGYDTKRAIQFGIKKTTVIVQTM